jgi:ribonuclease-3
MVARPRDQEELQGSIEYIFRGQALLREALTHSSYAHEKKGPVERDNERLEFLGDAVFGLAAAHYLSEQFPDSEEGELSRIRALLVGEEWLATAADRLGLGDFLLLGRGEEKSGGRSKRSILSGAVEALAGAVFLDGGWEAAYDLVTLLFRDAPAPGEILSRASDAKTELQELCQERFQQAPCYRLLSRSGPPHSPRFKVAALLGEKVLAEGRGASKKKAEQNAAAAAAGLIESTVGIRSPGSAEEENDRREE